MMLFIYTYILLVFKFLFLCIFIKGWNDYILNKSVG